MWDNWFTFGQSLLIFLFSNIKVVDICGMVLGVMKPHDLSWDIRFKFTVVIRQIWKRVLLSGAQNAGCIPNKIHSLKHWDGGGRVHTHATLLTGFQKHLKLVPTITWCFRAHSTECFSFMKVFLIQMEQTRKRPSSPIWDHFAELSPNKVYPNHSLIV